MIWPTRSQILVLFAVTLACLALSGAVPLTEESQGERTHPANPKESDQLPLHSQDQRMSPEGGNTAEDEAEKAKSHQVRSAGPRPGAQREPSYDDELFKDVDAKTLAAILLQALKVDEDKPSGREDPRWYSMGASPSTNYGSTRIEGKDLTENVKSRTRVGKIQRSPVSQQSEESEWREQANEEDTLTPQSIDRLEAMLQNMEKYSTAAKRERSNTAQRPLPMYNIKNDDESTENDVLRDLDAFEELVGRKEKYSDYEESQENARGRVKYGAEDLEAREGNRRKVGQQRAADRASDLLLQYLLRGEASEEEQEDEEKVREDQRMGGRGSEESASEEKRADEDEDEDEDIDPQTIDRLIEISSKLHLPADDVIDIINDVEKKRKDSAERIESRHGASRDRFKSSASRPDNSYLPRHRSEKARHQANDEMSLQDLLGAENALDYESMPFNIPRRYRPRPNGYPNYIHPRIYQQRHRPYYYQPAPPVYRNKDYYDDETQDNEEELENYIEKILLKHPEVFQ